ncbi:MAG: elongation factor Ts [Proteobacteria bacterium]|nr:elongation factor Ts [Pseudomonadota bacterium]
MSITAAMVNELRKETDAGMMACKNALTEANGDFEKAKAILRTKGQASAEKKSGRTAAEGLVVVKVANDGKSAAMVEINSETDFVARDQNFTQFANQVSETILKHSVTDVEKLAELTLQGTSETVEHARKNLVAKLGENIQVRRAVVLSGDAITGYTHSGRIGVLVNMKGGDATIAKDIAMHIAASNPVVVSAEEVSKELIDKEREIYKAQAQASGKPAEIVQKMIDGRINKYLEEVSLLGQPFVKDDKMKVSQLLKSHQAEVIQFVRYQVGEGIEKKEHNFAEEVMAQVQG